MLRLVLVLALPLAAILGATTLVGSGRDRTASDEALLRSLVPADAEVRIREGCDRCPFAAVWQPGSTAVRAAIYIAEAQRNGWHLMERAREDDGPVLSFVDGDARATVRVRTLRTYGDRVEVTRSTRVRDLPRVPDGMHDALDEWRQWKG